MSWPGFETVLVGSDLSETAEIAAQRAAEVARSHGAALLIVHVLSDESERADAEGRLAALAERVASGVGVAVKTRLVSGKPAEMLLETARDARADLVVVGTRGRSGLARLVLGSVAAALVERSGFPVLTVHAKDRSSLCGTRTILVPTDFSDDAMLAGELAMRFVGDAVAGMRVILVHAYRAPIPVAPIPPAPVYVPTRAEAAENVEQRLERTAGAMRRAGLEVETRVEAGDPATVIQSVATQSDVDLVVMGTRGLSALEGVLLGSTARRVLVHAPCPVLTIRRVS